MTYQRIAITGATGLLGSALLEVIPESIVLSKEDLNLLDLDNIPKVLSDLCPEVLINCAGYTNVDRAECESRRCFQLNTEAIIILDKVCKDLSIKPVYLSTNYVFNGQGTKPWTEQCKPNPCSVYGQSKFSAETFAAYNRSLIIRSAAFFGGLNPRGFWKYIQESTVEVLRVVDDQYINPTSVNDLAGAIYRLIQRDICGIVHVVNEGAASWYEFAVAILEELGNDRPIEKCTTDELVCLLPHYQARRPENGILDTSYYSTICDPLPHWRDAVKAYAHKCHEKSDS